MANFIAVQAVKENSNSNTFNCLPFIACDQIQGIHVKTVVNVC